MLGATLGEKYSKTLVAAPVGFYLLGGLLQSSDSESLEVDQLSYSRSHYTVIAGNWRGTL